MKLIRGLEHLSYEDMLSVVIGQGRGNDFKVKRIDLGR